MTPPTASTEPIELVSSKTLEGSLRSFSLFEILQFLRLGSLTGVLTVARGSDQIQLMIRTGKIVNSSIFTHRQRLGELLLVRGVITRRDLDEILAAKHKNSSDKPLGQILIDRGFLDKETLAQTLRLQVEEEIWALLQWRDGEFRFNPSNTLTEVAPALVEIEIEPLILEGARRQDEWKTISQHIGGDELVPVPMPPETFHIIDDSLTANEWRLLALVNGTLTVGGLVDRSGLGRFETYRILANFKQQCWITCETILQAEERTNDSMARRTGNDTGTSTREITLDESANGNGHSPNNTLSGLLRWKRPAAVSPDKPSQADTPTQVAGLHRTPVTMAAAFANELLIAAQRRRIEDIQRRWPLTALSWQRFTGQYPSADGVSVTNGLLDVAIFDALWAPLSSGPRATLIEDTWGAISELASHLLTALKRMLPAREWERLTTQMTNDLTNCNVEEPAPMGMTSHELLQLLELAKAQEA